MYGSSGSNPDPDVSMKVNTVVSADDGPNHDPFQEEGPMPSISPQVTTLIPSKPTYIQSDGN